MWMMKTENKGKRILAALLALCMSLQLFGWNMEPFQVFAGESGEKPLQKTITVSEKEILKALEKEAGESTEIDEEILPYIGTQREMAKDHLESLLSQAVIVKQKSLGGKCAAIVAVEADDELEEEELPDGEEVENQDEEEPDKGIDYDRILMIGINGNEKRDCEFTLEITNAEGIVVKELKVTGYRQDRELATDSNATATASNAKMTDSNALKIIRDEETAKTPTDSDTEEEDDRTYLFVEDYNEVYDEQAASKLLTVKKENGGIALLAFLGAEEEENGQEENVDIEDEVPKMMVRAGGFGMAALMKESADNNIASNLARVSLSADSEVWDSKNKRISIESGRNFTIYANATYSAINNTNIKKAFYTVEFKIKEPAENLVVGPEDDPNAVPVDTLTGEWKAEWDEIQTLLNSGSDDWKLVNVETFNFFYSKAEMMAVFSLQGESGQGSSISGIPFRFRFLNGLTPDGTMMAAVPGILNKQELEDDYSAHNNGASAGKQIDIGGNLDVICNAGFAWNKVKKSAQGNLEDLYGNANANTAIVYTIQTSPDYGEDKNSGVMYTKAYTVIDKMYFENFYIDSSDYEVFYNNPSRPGEFSLKHKTSGVEKKLIGLDLPESAMKDGVAEPIYADNSKNKIVGIEIRYTVSNDTLDSDRPSDLIVKSVDHVKKQNNRSEGQVMVWFHYANFRSTGLLKFEGDSLPRVTNNVYFDAYSVAYKGDDYSGSENTEAITEDKAHHHSYSQIVSTAFENYSITKKAYEDSECKTEAVGENQVFSPENVVYYKITVENKGYQKQSFRIEDEIPDGLKDLKLDSLKIGKKNGMQSINQLPRTETVPGKNICFWDNIEIPAGESAELYLSGTIKSKEEFGEQTANERLVNKVRYYFTGTAESKGSAEATVFVKLNDLTANELKFSKALKGNNGEVSIGSEVTYSLKAKLADNVAPQKITITDHWPEQLTLKKILDIPSGSVVTLKDVSGNVIASFKNEYGFTTSVTVPNSFKDPKDNKMLAEDVAKIRDVEIEVFVSQTEKTIQLVGEVKTGGDIINNASAGPVEGTVAITALAMGIEKKAYRIPSGEKDNITDANSLKYPIDEKVTFSADDVICYEIAVKNTGSKGQLAIKPVITDDFSNLFKLGDVPQLAEATLNGKKASVFVRRESEQTTGNWKPLTVTDGKLSLDLKDNPLEPQNIARIRIYVSVPEKAVGGNPLVFTNEAMSTLQIGGKDYSVKASASITTLKYDEQSASIKKEVIAVARDLITTDKGYQLINAKWDDEALFGTGSGYEPGTKMFTVGTGDYVFYRMKIHNSSETTIKLYEIQDWLPAGMKFSRFYTFNPDQKKQKAAGDWGADGTSDTLKLGTNINQAPGLPSDKQNWLFYEGVDPKNKYVLGVDYDSTVKHSNKFSSVAGTTYRARAYGIENIGDNSNEIAVVRPGKTVVFGIIAQVTGSNLKSGDILTNTAGFITDSTVSKESGANCGEVTEISKLAGMANAVGGKTYLTDEYKAFTSSADVMYSEYTPGIEKELSEFYVTGKWSAYDPDALNQNFAPTDWMRWGIKLSNGMYGHATAGAIEEYTVSDTLPLGLDYNSNDTEGNYFKTAAGKTVLLPEPVKTTNADGKIVVSWDVKKTGNKYEIVGANGRTVSTQENLSIPARGFIDLQVSTKKAENAAGLRYGTYENRADLIPAAKYTYSNNCAGQIEGAEPDRTIYATAQVNIFGSGRTESWKEISGSYNGITNSTTGRDTDNYILSDAGGTVTYSLHIQNPSSGTLDNVVIMDHLPAVGDNGLVNNSKRYSDFAVKFAEDLNLQVSIGTYQLADTEYKAYFGTWSDLASPGSALSDAQWKIDNRNGWDKNYSDGHDSIRIEITDVNVLSKLTGQTGAKANESLTVSFDAVVPEADELKNLDSSIAWNTFGYSYEIGGQSSGSGGTFLSVEPAKVGVKIPTAQLSIKKEVESQIAGDDTKQFTFILEKKENGGITNFFADQWVPVERQKYTIDGQIYFTGPDSQTTTENGRTLGAGEFLLTKDQQADFTVIANSEYRVRELDADGFVVKVTPFTTDAKGEFAEYNGQNPPTVEAVAGEKYFCTFKNIKSSLVLPETGGMGTGRFHMAGIFTIMLAALLAAGYWMISISKLKKEKDGN